ncbi:MAG TPA: glycine cleavage system protein H [Thermoanaerobaculia bacterium]|nr:glycine cleavage system protein H [Thermoanaerobaculia bacterium]
MVAIFVILTFVVALLIDHLLDRKPLPIAQEKPLQAPARPRLTPAIVAGFEVPDNLLYHRGHTWAAAETPDLVRVGVDDFAAKLAGEITSVDVPQRGQWIRQGQRIIAMHHNGREIDLVSPIEGTVVDLNETALTNPTAVRNDPYGDGWLLTVNSPDAKTNFRNLLGGTLARRWMDDAAARLRAFAVPAGALAQDGGVAVSSLIEQLPDVEWEKAEKEFFL